MKKVIGIGNALVDALVQMDDDSLFTQLGLEKGGMHLISSHEAAHIRKLFDKMNVEYATGGSARNTAHALARLGAEVGFIGKIGRDETGAFFRDNCQETGIDLKLIECDLPSGIAHTFITPDGERTFGTHLGAAALMTEDEMTDNLLEGYDYLYVEGYLVQNHPMIERIMRMAKDKGMKICIDLASFNIVLGDKEFFTHLVEEYTDIVFANEEEAHSFTGSTDPVEAAKTIARMCQMAVVKMGAKGVCIVEGEQTTIESSIKVDHVVDTTAAGDFFAGGFMLGLTKGLSTRKCAQIGSLMGGTVIQYIGTKVPESVWTELKEKTETIEKS